MRAAPYDNTDKTKNRPIPRPQNVNKDKPINRKTKKHPL